MRVSIALLLVSLSLLSLLPSSLSQTLTVVSSIQATKDRLTVQPPVNFSQTQPRGDVLTLFPSIQFQNILGFGGALTEAAATTWLKLPAALQAEVLRAYYNSSEGHRYRWGRVPIGSCDFTDFSYNFDNVTDDFDLKAFDTNATQDRQTIIPLIKAIQAIAGRQLKLFGTPWSPPGWMKNNGQMDGSAKPCLKADPRYQTAWANYFVKWFQTYESFGIPFWGLTIQNEPENAGAWESCYFTAEEEMAFLLDYLYPALRRPYPDLNIMMFDHNKDHALNWARVFYENPRAFDIVWGIAIHWYSGDSFDNVRQIHEEWPQKHIMATEACNCDGPHYGQEAWNRAELYVHDILGDLNAFSRGWTDWNILLDQQGGPNHLGNFCDAPLIANLTANPPVLIYQDTYYAMGHFSRFLPQGATRIGTSFSAGSSTLEWAAFLVQLDDPDSWAERLTADRSTHDGVQPPPADVVVIVYNPTGSQQELVLQADEWFARVPVPAHSFHTLSMDARLFGPPGVEAVMEVGEGGKVGPKVGGLLKTGQE